MDLKDSNGPLGLKKCNFDPKILGPKVIFLFWNFCLKGISLMHLGQPPKIMSTQKNFCFRGWGSFFWGSSRTCFPGFAFTFYRKGDLGPKIRVFSSKKYLKLAKRLFLTFGPLNCCRIVILRRYNLCIHLNHSAEQHTSEPMTFCIC